MILPRPWPIILVRTNTPEALRCSAEEGVVGRKAKMGYN
jgi:hypothetical protein